VHTYRRCWSQTSIFSNTEKQKRTAHNLRGSKTGKEILIKSVSGCLNVFTRSHIERKSADETNYMPCRGHIIKQDSLGSKAMTYNTPWKSLVTPIDKNCCRPKWRWSWSWRAWQLAGYSTSHLSEFTNVTRRTAGAETWQGGCVVCGRHGDAVRIQAVQCRWYRNGCAYEPKVEW